MAGPLHVLLTGRRDEKDRRLTVEKAPSYGLVDKEVTLSYRIDDRPAPKAAPGVARARTWLRRDGVEIKSTTVPVGSALQVAFALEHGGPTVIELEVETTPGELSTLNNRAVITIHGVRERLRVLLISGQPHAGERTWRNLLKSDPSVDLVHFTILRPPEKDDLTPLRELALIVFPIRELFEVKLKDFNLIVFDRYVVRDVLPPSYLRNIENYVRQGGALMLAVGPEFAGLRSLFHTPLGSVMPGIPTGRVLEQGYRPTISDVGSRHPVTATLIADPRAKPRWGRWFRQIEAGRDAGDILMDGIEERPLLILKRVDKGRVAQLMSDHIWLWARQFEGGGPQGELLRRLAHWLMKEPDLEEESLAARARGGRLVIERRSLATAVPPVTVTAPSGATEKVALKAASGGRAPGHPGGPGDRPLSHRRWNARRPGGGRGAERARAHGLEGDRRATASGGGGDRRRRHLDRRRRTRGAAPAGRPRYRGARLDRPEAQRILPGDRRPSGLALARHRGPRPGPRRPDGGVVAGRAVGGDYKSYGRLGRGTMRRRRLAGR